MSKKPFRVDSATGALIFTGNPEVERHAEIMDAIKELTNKVSSLEHTVKQLSQNKEVKESSNE